MKRILVLAVTLVAASCSNQGTTTTTVPETTAAGSTTAATTTTSAAPETSDPVSDAPMIPQQLSRLELATIQLDRAELLVAVAETAAQRRQGLMNVSDLLDIDGMLFAFDADTSGGFWMKDTLLPLDIAFFDSDGAFVDGFVMEPCTTDDCPTYFPDGPYRYALEMVEGSMPENPQNLRIE